MWGKTLIILAIVAVSHAKPQRRTEPSDQCPSDRHFLLPHEWDCTKFYYCEYGMKWIEPRPCSPGTEFSFELQVCIHPELANCELPGVPPTDGPEPTTSEPTTPEPTTPEPTTPEPTTPEPTTPEPTTPEPTTPEPTTPEPTTPEPTTPEPTTPEPTTPEPTTPEPTTPEPTTPEPTTPEPTTPKPTTPEPTTPEPTTPEPTTPEPTTPEPTTPEPTTPEPTTPEPTTPEPTTPEPTTPEPTTPEPTTPEPTTPEPTTPKPTTPEPTTPEPTTPEPTTPEPTTPEPTTPEPTTPEPTTPEPTTPEPTIPEPTTPEPTTPEPTTPEPTTPEPTTPKPTPEPESSSSEELLQPSECPSDFSIHQLLPHETECNLFYYCNFGEKVLRECPTGTHFNPELQVCDWPKNVKCGNASNSNENGSSDENSGSDENGGSSENGGLLPNGCPSDFDVHQLLPHETDCSKFYYCNFGEKLERDCPGGLHFNPELQVCDWPQNVKCGNSGNSNENGSSDENGESGENGGSNENSESNETGGSSENGGSDENGGSNENGGSDENGGSSENSGSNENGGLLPNGCPSDFSIHQLLPHETDCSKFYYCNFGDKVLAQCGGGLHFNPQLQVCDWPADAGCEVKSGESSQSGEDSNEIEDNKCKDSCNVEPWAHDDCDKFWRCAGANPVLVYCSEGLQFNVDTKTCDFACNVNCVRDNIEVTHVNNGYQIFLPSNRVDYHTLEVLRNNLH